MSKKVSFEMVYDKDEDMLFIHSKKGKTKESVEISEDVIVDIDKNNNLVGMEFFHASEFFRTLNRDITKKFLGNVKDVKISMKRYRNWAIITLELRFEKKLIREKLPALQLKEYESPLLASIAA